MPANDFSTLLDKMPAAGQAVLIAALVLGLAIWLFGRKLAKPLCVLLGLVIGAAAGLVIAHALGSTSLIIWAGIGGAIGAVSAWLLFRVWMGVTLGIVLAIAAPATMLVIVGARPPVAATAPVQEQFIDFKEDVEEGREPGLQDRVSAIYEQQRDEATAWWKSLGGSVQKRVVFCAIGGSLLGLLLGLIKPKIAAAVMAALLGSVLIVLAGDRLLAVNAADFYAKLPTGPRITLAAVGLITILGLALQWTFSKRKADK